VTRRRIFNMVMLSLALAGGCVVPISQETPISSSGWKPVDPRGLVGRPTSKIRVGVMRPVVHELLLDKSKAPPGCGFGTGAVESYAFASEGKFFFCGPNPEGGFIGINHRHIRYVLEIRYDSTDVVRFCELKKTEDIYDAHESYWSWPP